MSFDVVLRRWIGSALLLAGAVSSLWLAAVGKLTLYIHPRYLVFTVIMATLAVLLVVGGWVTAPRAADHDHEHDHDHGPAGDQVHGRTDDHHHGTGEGARRPDTRRRILTGVQLVILVGSVIALLAVPPSTLSSRATLDRGLMTSTDTSGTDTTSLSGGDPATFSVKDWASLLRTGGPDAVVGRHVRASGYVLDQGGDDQVFYLVRIMITCCAVDAQPVGVPVLRPGWRQEYRPGTWLELDGQFTADTDAHTQVGAVITPTSLTRIAEPDRPYVF